MLDDLRPKLPKLCVIESVDELLEPMLAAARLGTPLEPPLLQIIRPLGFESFFYGLTTGDGPSRDCKTYVWTNQPESWVRAYDANAYLEVDPRILGAWNRRSPFLWDAAKCRRDPRTARFLRHAAEYGICSGVMISFSLGNNSRAGFALNSPISPVTNQRHLEITRNLGTVMVLASRLHDLFMSHYVNRGVPPMQQGAPLSARERQCLQLAARGMTSGDIGIKLGIACRTVNYHFGNVLSKLGVLNRNEAIAKAVSQGLIQFSG